MSRKGNCWDNAVAERFFLNLKMERVWQRQYANHAEAKADITDYIVGFYNCTGSIQHWAICRPPSMNGKWQHANLSLCPRLLDHSTMMHRYFLL
jgi:hypothetical protein